MQQAGRTVRRSCSAELKCARQSFDTRITLEIANDQVDRLAAVITGFVEVAFANARKSNCLLACHARSHLGQ